MNTTLSQSPLSWPRAKRSLSLGGVLCNCWVGGWRRVRLRGGRDHVDICCPETPVLTPDCSHARVSWSLLSKPPPPTPVMLLADTHDRQVFSQPDWEARKEFPSDQAHCDADQGVSGSLVNETSLCTRSPWSNPHFQEKPWMSDRACSGGMSNHGICFFCFACLFAFLKRYILSPCPSLSCLPAFPSVLHIQTLSLSLSELKETS